MRSTFTATILTKVNFGFLVFDLQPVVTEVFPKKAGSGYYICLFSFVLLNCYVAT